MSRPRGAGRTVDALLAIAEERWRQYLRGGDALVLSEAISRLEEAEAAWPAASVLMNLGVALTARHQVLGEPGDLNRAVNLFRAAAMEPQGGPVRGAARAGLGLALVSVYERTGRLSNLQEAAEALRDSVAATPPGDPSHATALASLGSVLRELGRPLEAVPYHEQALALFRQIGDRLGEARVLSNLGNCYRQLGRLNDARLADEQALEIFRDAGDRRNQAHVLSNLGSILRELQQPAQAFSLHKEALEIFGDTGDRHGRARVLYNLGSVLRELRQPAQALSVQQQALVLFRDAGDRHSEGAVLADLAESLRELGRVTEAIQASEQALVLFRDAEDRHSQARVLLSLSKSFLAQDQPDAMNSALDQAIALLESAGEFRAADAARTERPDISSPLRRALVLGARSAASGGSGISSQPLIDRAQGGTLTETLRRGTRVTGEDRSKLATDLKNRYDAGESIRSLATSTGRSYGFIHRILTETGVTLRGRGGATRK